MNYKNMKKIAAVMSIAVLPVQMVSAAEEKAVAAVVHPLAPSIGLIISRLDQMLAALAALAKPAVVAVAEPVAAAAKPSAFVAMRANASKAQAALVAGAQKAGATVKHGVQSFGANVKNRAQSAGAYVTTTAKNAGTNVKAFASSAYTNVSGGAQYVFTTAEDKLASAYDAVLGRAFSVGATLNNTNKHVKAAVVIGTVVALTGATVWIVKSYLARRAAAQNNTVVVEAPSLHDCAEHKEDVAAENAEEFQAVAEAIIEQVVMSSDIVVS